MKTRWIESAIHYDGSQLRPHWIYRATGLVGDALVAFRGGCRVAPAEMADVADLQHGPGIAGADMLHFLWEVFDDCDLTRAVLRQRLLVALALEELRALRPDAALRRDGDDLFAGERKLSISVATRSTVSTLVHFAINVASAGAPVPIASLTDLGVDVRAFADRLLAAAQREDESIAEARCLVRGKAEAEHAG